MAASLGSSAGSDAMLDLYVVGLKNAHALEKSATQLLERQIERVENYPEVNALLRRHLGETEQQIQRLDEILDSFGEENPMLKDLATSITGNLAALGHTVMGDEILKNHFANHAFENFEIAAYVSLITMAEASGRNGHVAALNLTLQEERTTAQLLHDMTPELTRTYMQRSASGQKADR
ncbi:ferritin-like domain-containing protein [uncultured Enterovirga sp.]|uniref:ferritin-like domain-containing protein n=1 Tax=uncultured Enterovirga sp. TaxID=2026352 RepID=UPI0035C96C90